MKIHQWEEISDQFHKGTILLGNGASMALSDKFGYTSLLEKAKETGSISKEINEVFKKFKTNDFELVLRMIWQASTINKILEIEDNRTTKSYKQIRDALISAVRTSNPEFKEISIHMDNICRFLKKFDTVLSLNYDLIVYWAMMHQNKKNDGHVFKDCFIKQKFDPNWYRFWEALEYKNEKECTLVFYPHGCLALSRTKLGLDRKIHCHSDKDLLKSVLQEWKSGDYIPLFVSEGREEQKISAIQSSFYLSTVYREVLGGINETLTIYGWSIGKQDTHLLERLKNSGTKNIAISVYNEDRAYMKHADETIKKIMGNVGIKFFDSESPGCWIHPHNLNE